MNSYFAKGGFAAAVLFISSLSAFGQSSSSGQLSVTTYHNDISRSGLNARETVLTPSTVGPSTFGLLFTLPVDGRVYAQPLYLPNVLIPGKGFHNVLYVVTEHNSVYAFDADSNLLADSTPLWHVNLGPSVPAADATSSNIVPEIGITGTPVIDTAGSTPVMFVVAKTKTVNANGRAIYTASLHALSVTTGAEELGGPTVITAQVPGSGDGSINGVLTFNTLIENQRNGLLLLPSGAGGAPTVYICFGSHNDNGAYHGWVYAYSATNLKQIAAFCTTPNGVSGSAGKGGGGIWGGGFGPASDGSSIYLATGNGWFDSSTNCWGDSVLRLSASTLDVLDYFTPYDQAHLDAKDLDLGSGGVMLLPSTVGSSAHKNILYSAGKDATIRLLDTAELGGYNGATDQNVQTVINQIKQVFGGPAYFNGNVYIGTTTDMLQAWPVVNGAIAATSTNMSTLNSGFPGVIPVISASGTTNGIVWAVETDGFSTGAPAILHAFQATNLAKELYNSSLTGGRDTMGPAIEFLVPTVVNGKVYVGTTVGVNVFGKLTLTPQTVPKPK